MEVHEEVLARLDALGVPYRLLAHPPVHTMEDCAAPARALGGVMPKNLFLTPRSRSAFYLCVARPDAVFRTSEVSRQAGSARLSFAPEEDLFRLLRTRPGAISPLGLLLEEAAPVRLLMDAALRDEPCLVFHPCVNTFSLALSGDDFFGKVLPATGHAATWVSMRATGA